MWIRKTLQRDFSKLVLRAAGNQTKVACRNLQICDGIEAKIEGTIHVVRSRREERGVARGGRGQDTAKEGTEKIAEGGRVGNGEYEKRGQTLVTQTEDDSNGITDREMRSDEVNEGK